MGSEPSSPPLHARHADGVLRYEVPLLEALRASAEPLNKFNAINIFSYVKFSNSVTMLVVLHWTPSIFFNVSPKCGNES
ncbi:unnamed protein product [Bubo scandiacus]